MTTVVLSRTRKLFRISEMSETCLRKKKIRVRKQSLVVKKGLGKHENGERERECMWERQTDSPHVKNISSASLLK